MLKHCLNMKEQELIKPVVKMGNSACVLLPKAWIDGKARVELIEKPLDIKRDLFEILSPYLEDIHGIYLAGSYAREEQTPESDVDVIVISKNLKKEIIHRKYHISIYTLESVEKTIKENTIMILPRLLEAKTILNQSLLEELKRTTTKIRIKEFIQDTRRIIKIDKGFIKLDKEDGKILKSESVIYSLMLRLRTVFLIKILLDKKIYSKKLFKNWLIREIGNEREVDGIYSIYEKIRDNKKNKIEIEISSAEKTLNLLKKEVKKLEKRE